MTLYEQIKNIPLFKVWEKETDLQDYILQTSFTLIGGTGLNLYIQQNADSTIKVSVSDSFFYSNLRSHGLYVLSYADYLKVVEESLLFYVKYDNEKREIYKHTEDNFVCLESAIADVISAVLRIEECCKIYYNQLQHNELIDLNPFDGLENVKTALANNSIDQEWLEAFNYAVTNMVEDKKIENIIEFLKELNQ